MGVTYDDLEGHEGYGARRLPDGSLTGSWTAATASFASYVAACDCGWQGTDHPPTEDGRQEALEDWDEHHARPLLALAVPREIAETMTALKAALSRLGQERPLAAAKAVKELACWAEATLSRLEGAHRVAAIRPGIDPGDRGHRLRR